MFTSDLRLGRTHVVIITVTFRSTSLSPDVIFLFRIQTFGKTAETTPAFQTA